VSDGAAADVGCVLGAIGAGLVLIPRSRVALVGGLALLVAGMALLATSLVPGHDFRLLVASPARVGALAVAAIVLVAAGVLLAHRPALVTVALLVAAPFRVPVHVGDQKAFLLVPLYAVLVVAAVGLLLRLLRRDELPDPPRWLTVPAAVFIGLSSLSLLWTEDLRAGTIQLLFFLLPFAVLTGFVARVALAAWSTRAFAVTIVLLACGFAAVGFSQLWTGELYFARDLEVANAYTSYFRTTSLFADSSVYGRELAAGIVVLVTALWLARVSLPLAVAVIALLWTALYFTYSQSSMVALVIAVLAVSIVAADRLNRRVLVAGTAVAVIVAAALVVVEVRDQPVERATSGRFELVKDTWHVFVDQPVVGVGIGAQPRASRDQNGARTQTERNASHTTPLTVASELGLVGIIAYLALLAAAARALLAVARVDRSLGLGLFGVFVLLFVHSLFYSGFFENPVTWGILAVAAAVLATRGAREPLSEASRGSLSGPRTEEAAPAS
jgi:O-antigen ligase